MSLEKGDMPTKVAPEYDALVVNPEKGAEELPPE